MSAPSPRWKIAAALFAVYVIWGSTYLAIQIAIRTLPVFTMAGARFLSAGLLLFGFAKLRGHAAAKLPEWRGATLVGGLMLLGGNGGVCWAEQKVPSGLAAILIASVPLWIALLDWLRPGGKRPRLAVSTGILIGFAGVAILVGPGASAGVDPVGSAVLTASAFSWALGSILSSRVRLPASPLMATACEMIAGGALLLFVGAIAGEFAAIRPSEFSRDSLLAVAYLVVFGSLVAFTAYIWLLRTVSPALATTYAYVNPIVALFLGWLFQGERLAPRTFVASAVIIAAVALITTAKGKKEG